MDNKYNLESWGYQGGQYHDYKLVGRDAVCFDNVCTEISGKPAVSIVRIKGERWSSRFLWNVGIYTTKLRGVTFHKTEIVD